MFSRRERKDLRKEHEHNEQFVSKFTTDKDSHQGCYNGSQKMSEASSIYSSKYIEARNKAQKRKVISKIVEYDEVVNSQDDNRFDSFSCQNSSFQNSSNFQKFDRNGK